MYRYCLILFTFSLNALSFAGWDWGQYDNMPNWQFYNQQEPNLHLYENRRQVKVLREEDEVENSGKNSLKKNGIAAFEAYKLSDELKTSSQTYQDLRMGDYTSNTIKYFLNPREVYVVGLSMDETSVVVKAFTQVKEDAVAFEVPLDIFKKYFIKTHSDVRKRKLSVPLISYPTDVTNSKTGKIDWSLSTSNKSIQISSIDMRSHRDFFENRNNVFHYLTIFHVDSEFLPEEKPFIIRLEISNLGEFSANNYPQIDVDEVYSYPRTIHYPKLSVNTSKTFSRSIPIGFPTEACAEKFVKLFENRQIVKFIYKEDAPQPIIQYNKLTSRYLKKRWIVDVSTQNGTNGFFLEDLCNAEI